MFAKFQCVRATKWLFLTTIMVAFLGTTTTKSVVAQANQSPILYFFTNDGCAPCLSVKPAIDRLTANGYPIKTLKAAEHAFEAWIEDHPQCPTCGSELSTHALACGSTAVQEANDDN